MEIGKNVSENMNFRVVNTIFCKNAKMVLKFGPKCTIGRRRYTKYILTTILVLFYHSKIEKETYFPQKCLILTD